VSLDARIRWTLWGVLVLGVLMILWGLSTGCQAILSGADRVWEPLTENGFRAILALGVGFLLWIFIPAGEVARVLVALFGVFLVQEATTPATVTVHDHPGSMIPWYLDPSAWIRTALSWIAVAVVLGLLWPRSRQQTIAALGELLSFPPHPIRAGRRFLAGLGFLHSDPVPSKKTDKAIAAARLPKDTP
jgi:hypothetical protein